MVLLHDGAHVTVDVRQVDVVVGRVAASGGSLQIRRALLHPAQFAEIHQLGGGVLELVVVAQHQAAGAGGERFAELETGEGDDLVLAEGPGIVQLAAGGPVPAVHVGHVAETAGLRGVVGRHSGFGVDLLVGVVEQAGDVALLVGLPVRGAVIGLVHQLRVGGEALHDLEEQVAVIAHVLAGSVLDVVVVFIHQIDAQVLELAALGIVAVQVRAEKPVGAVLVRQRLIGRIGPGAVGSAGALRTLLAIDTVHGDGGGEPGSHVIGALVVHRHLVVETVDGSGVVRAVVDHETALELFRAAAQGQVVLLEDLAAVDGVAELLREVVLGQPVADLVDLALAVLALRQHVVRIADGRDAAGAVGQDAFHGRERIGHLALAVDEIIVVVVPLHLHLLLRRQVEVGAVVQVPVLEDGDVGGEVHVDASFLAGALGGDDDDTVGGAGAVDGRRGGVLQDVDALDVIGVQVVDVSFDRQAVHHQQRAGFRIHGTDTADGELAAVGRQARHAAFQVLQEGGAVAFLDGLGADRRDSARHLPELDFLITRDHGAFQEILAVGQRNVKAGTSRKLLGNGIHAEERYFHGRLLGVLDEQGVITVGIRGGKGLFGQVLDDGADDRLSVRSRDASAHLDALGSSVLRRNRQKNCKQKHRQQ